MATEGMRSAAKLQEGTPLLLRTLEGGQDKLQICTFWVAVDRKGPGGPFLLKWQEQDGDGLTHETPISAIAKIEDVADGGSEEEPGMIRLAFSGQQRGRPKAMELICASSEDFQLWRDGLHSLIDSPALSPTSPAAAKAMAGIQAGKAKASALAASLSQRAVSISSNGSSPVSGSPSRANQADALAAGGIRAAEGISQLLERVKLQDELIGELKQENGRLTQLVKQKDAMIGQLSSDLQRRGSKEGHCSKTESTSRESDDHLRDRETAILRRKNAQLKKMVQKKQKTITNLMQTLQNALGGQTSDGDMLKTEDDGDDVDSDTGPSPAAATVATSSVTAPTFASEESDSEPEAMREEMRALTGKLELLEQSVEGLSLPKAPAGHSFQPPPRSAPNAPTPSPQSSQQLLRSSPGAAAGAVARKELLAKAAAPQRGLAGFDFSGVGGAPPAVGGSGGMSQSSKTALEALTREAQLLEEKKRVVEQLARHLEPASDEEEDDGFPLQ